MPSVTKCMLRMQEKQAQVRSRIDDLNFEEKTRNKIVWDNKTLQYVDKLRGEGKLALYHLGMLVVCQAIGYNLQGQRAERFIHRMPNSVERLFHRVPQETLEGLGKFLQKDANQVVDVITQMRKQTVYEAPKHRIEHEENLAKLTDQEIEQAQKYIHELSERSLTFLNTLAQSEKEMRKFN